MFQGVFVEYDPYWEMAWNSFFWTGSTGDWLGDFTLHPHRPSPILHDPEYFGIRNYDIDWRPNWWNYYCSIRGLKAGTTEPFQIVFRLKPVGKEDANKLRQLRYAILNGRFLSRIEERPTARLVATKTTSAIEGGELIRSTSGQTGTLGGVLSAANTNAHYALTCAHVAATGDDVEVFDVNKSSWRKIGHVIEASSFSPHPQQGAQCYFNKNAMDVDIALIELISQEKSTRVKGIGPIVDLIDSANLPRSVEVYGGYSGKLQLEANKFGIWQELEMPDGNFQCFSKIFELETKKNWSISNNIQNIIKRNIQTGDSGSWVCAHSSGGSSVFSVCGQIIGSDTISGFACMMDSIKKWSSDNTRQTPLALRTI